MLSENSRPGAIVIEGHVQGLSNTRSLGEKGIPVIVVDTTDCIAKHSKYCQSFYICPPFNSDNFAEFLISLAESKGLQGWILYPSNDHAVYSISKKKSQLEKFYKVITPSIDVIDNIYNKSKLLDIASSIGVPIPKTYYLKTHKEQLNGLRFPVLTKGRFGLSFYKSMGKKVFIAKTQKELKIQLEEIEKKLSLNEIFTQELIPYNGSNKTISFTAFCIDGEIKVHWMGVKLREHPVQFGTATFAKSVFIQECFDQSIPLLKSLKYTGVCEVEYLKDPRDNRYKLIEINARTWLWVGLAKACGVDYAKIIYDYINGHSNIQTTNYQLNRYWYNPITDFVFSIIGIINGKVSFIDYIKSIFFIKKTNAIFSLKDIKPGFAYIFNLMQFYKTR